ncbi:MAG: extracellular solute-binding protein, partial [Anaerolineae bacterium]|nr:extracellular solute-binding protein [Anaerolineae bacterium]
MRIRSFLLLSLTLAFVLALGSVVVAQDEMITLNFWRPDRSPESDPPAIWDDTGELITAWTEAHPNIQVNINPIPFNELDTTELTALRAGSSDVDVLLVNHVTIGAAVGTGGLEPLDDCIASQDSLVPSDWIPGLYAAGQREGIQYTLPFDTDTRVMYYNKALLEAAGIDKVPETWDELYAAFDAIEALDTDAAPFYYPGLNKWFVLYHTVGPWLVEKNTSFLNPDGDTSTTLDPATVEAWNHAIKLASYAPEASLTYNGEELEPLFAQGKMGFLFT